MGQATSEDLQKQIDELKKEKEKLDAEKAKLDAEKAKLDAEKALADTQKASQSSSSQDVTNLQNQKALVDAQKALAESQKALDQAKNASTQDVADLQNQKALVDAQKALAESQKALDQAKNASTQQVTDLQNQKALADAQKALADAQAQAALAKYIGDVKAGPYSGSVDVKDKTGTEEALLLAARAVKEAATKIGKAVAPKGDKFYIFGAKEFPNFQRLSSFRFRKELLIQAFLSAGVVKPTDQKVEAVTPNMVSAGLDALSKILGFFKTDYTVGGIDAKLDESLLLFAVAGELAAKEVHLPLLYEPDAQNNTVSALAKELAELVDLRTRALTASTQRKATIDDVEKRAADPANAATKDALLQTAANLKPSVDQLHGVIALYDTFATELTTADANGGFPLAVIAQEFSIDGALRSGGHVLLLRLENSGGGYLVKKNLFTALGSMPLFHMGGATVTYLLLNGTNGRVVAADAVPVYGGFIQTEKLREELSK